MLKKTDIGTKCIEHIFTEIPQQIADFIIDRCGVRGAESIGLVRRRWRGKVGQSREVVKHLDSLVSNSFSVRWSWPGD